MLRVTNVRASMSCVVGKEKWDGGTVAARPNPEEEHLLSELVVCSLPTF